MPVFRDSAPNMRQGDHAENHTGGNNVGFHGIRFSLPAYVSGRGCLPNIASIRGYSLRACCPAVGSAPERIASNRGAPQPNSCMMARPCRPCRRRPLPHLLFMLRRVPRRPDVDDRDRPHVLGRLQPCETPLSLNGPTYHINGPIARGLVFLRKAKANQMRSNGLNALRRWAAWMLHRVHVDRTPMHHSKQVAIAIFARQYFGINRPTSR